jgi:peptidoglycan/xylan/chitin deacetylase (PgdA/CDA1 family)
MYGDSVSHLALAVGSLLAGGTLLLIYSASRGVLREFRRDRVPALLYHQLVPRDKPCLVELTNPHRAYVVYDNAFAEQMAYLDREGYTPISLDDFLAYQEGQALLPERPIILTFDDGFASNYHYAFPILKRYGMRATIFATPDRGCENFKKHAATDSPLTQAQMREMSEYDISIQSHGMTHRYLTELESDVVRWELIESKKTLENILQRPVEYLAVPSGAYNRAVKTLAKEAGYKAVFCMLKGSNNKKSDRYALRRLVIGREVSINDFQRILQPSMGCYLRFTSSVQNILHFTLGPRGLDALRDLLYGSWLGSVLTPGQLTYLVPTLAVFVVFTLAFSAILLLRIYF